MELIMKTPKKINDANLRSHRLHKAERNQKARENHLRIRKIVVEHYGGLCACCGETIFQFLCIDHINGGGGAHRKEIGTSTSYWYWLINNNFPSGYRILCNNCNQATTYGRKCPHEELRELAITPTPNIEERTV